MFSFSSSANSLTGGLALLILSGGIAQAQSGYREVTQPTTLTFGDSPAQAQTFAPAPQSSPPIVQGSGSYNAAVSQPSQIVDDTGCYQCAVEPAPAPAPPKKDKPNPVAKSHKTVFYANDFSYLDDPNNSSFGLGDTLKRLGQRRNLDIGGQFRLRLNTENGQGQQAGFTRFQDTDNQFLLARLRLYADWQVSDRIRVFAEGIYADVVAQNEEYIPRPIDENFGDFLNLFADIQLNDNTSVRIGRQELLFGDQRLISPLDWANTRRTFTGVRLSSKYENVNADLFYTQLVPPNVDEFDTPNEDINFFGGYLTFTQLENKVVDLYYLGLINETGVDTDLERVNTWGARITGSTERKLLYDGEFAAQSGTRNVTDQDIVAFSGTAGVGYKFANRRWKPALWFFYDFASGDDANDASEFTRFNELFPLGHKYLGFIDAVTRGNVQSPNVRLALAPSNRLKLLFWYYNFQTDEDTDIITSLGATPDQDLTSSDFGNELDFTASYQLTPRSNVLFGYSRFWRGARIIGDTDADFAYLQWQTNF